MPVTSQAAKLFLTPTASNLDNAILQNNDFLSSRKIAEEALKQGQTRQAFVLLESWVDDHPDDLEAFFQLAQVSYKLGDFHAMRRYLEILKTLAPHDKVTEEALTWASPLPELQSNTTEDINHRKLLNLARSLRDQNENPYPYPNTRSDSNINNESPENRLAQVNSNTKQTQSINEINTIPIVKEASIDPKNKNSEKQTVIQGNNQITTSSPSNIGAAASVEPSNKTTLLTQEQIAQNFQMLQQLMMMQIMNNPSNNLNTNNPFGMMPMYTQDLKGMQGFNPSANQGITGGLNPQMINQMMQNSLLNNMNGMFNTNTDNQSNNNGFGF
jgi:tetratricopeptide (TPR) repeat protein